MPPAGIAAGRHCGGPQLNPALENARFSRAESSSKQLCFRESILDTIEFRHR
jgi:hypothetical protein